MQTEELVLEEAQAPEKAEFAQQMLRQLRALDTYDTYQGWSETKILEPLVMSKERKRSIPIVGDPDEITLSRVKAFYNSIASLIEQRSGMMATPVINLTHEGFGRALVTVGRLIVVDKTLRDVHRFGFETLAKMNGEGDKLVAQALELIEKFPDAANY